MLLNAVVCSSYNLDLEEEKREGVTWADYKTLPLSEQGTMCVTGPRQARLIPLLLSLLLSAVLEI